MFSSQIKKGKQKYRSKIANGTTIKKTATHARNIIYWLHWIHTIEFFIIELEGMPCYGKNIIS